MGIFGILGNVSSFFAMGTDAVSATRKTPKGVLLTQTVSQIFYGTASVLLHGYSGAVQNGVSILRNLCAIGKKQQKWIEWLLIALGVGLGIWFNDIGWLGWLPVIANLEYSLAVFRFREDEYSLKIAFALNVVMFGVYNGVIGNYVGLLANAIVFAMTMVYLLRGRQRVSD